MSARSLVAPLIFLAATAAAPATYRVALWADGDTVARRTGVVRVDPHPCGNIAIVRLSAMPPWREGGRDGLTPELIAETGTYPESAMRWSAPVDYQPLAISGSEILIDHGGQLLWIGTDGGIRREPRGRRYPPLRAMTCPSGGVHRASEYARCAGLTDLRSSRRRTIQYEGVCT
ncbi:MAG TPA: hypothetical protein VIT38_07920 [Allosphingosinicella sp.]|jgi:hypothetical protein